MDFILLMARVRFIPIKPKHAKLIDETKLSRELRGALDHTANIIRDDFNKTVQTWEHKPKFTKEVRFQEADVYTESEIYTYVVRGTEPHLIIGRIGGGRGGRPGLLSFRTSYRAKTRPRVISSYRGGASGPRVFTPAVQHPGTEARNFDKEIARRRERNLFNLVRLAFRKAVRTS